MPRRLDGRLALALLLLAVSGCFLAGPRTPPPFDVVVVGRAYLNPDESGQSLPTVVRIYQLKSAAKLREADFAAVYRNPKEGLGEDLLAMEEVVLAPNATERRRLDRKPEARALAAVAIFRRASGAAWRAIAELPPDAPGPFTFVLEGSKVEQR